MGLVACWRFVISGSLASGRSVAWLPRSWTGAEHVLFQGSARCSNSAGAPGVLHTVTYAGTASTGSALLPSPSFH